MPSTLTALTALAEGRNRDPFAVLGPHITDAGIVIRAFQPAARSIDVVIRSTSTRSAMKRRDPGHFEATLPGDTVPDYRLRLTYANGESLEIDDPYRYGKVLTDLDLYLLGEGTHF